LQAEKEKEKERTRQSVLSQVRLYDIGRRPIPGYLLIKVVGSGGKWWEVVEMVKVVKMMKW
jgi:hypothetical protein